MSLFNKVTFEFESRYGVLHTSRYICDSTIGNLSSVRATGISMFLALHLLSM